MARFWIPAFAGMTFCCVSSRVPSVIRLMSKRANNRDNTNAAKQARRKPARKCNALDGKRWLQNSISVWSDIRKTTEETRLKHPALFPTMLVERLIETFLPPDGNLILDPFAGIGSTLVAAQKLGRRAIGVELSPEFAAVARKRLTGGETASEATARKGERISQCEIVVGSANDLAKWVAPNSVDLCVTSPPYWDILNQRRTADMKATRHYGNLEHDLGTIADYHAFLDALVAVCRQVLAALKPGAYCCVVVMDLRKKNRFFPLHSDLATRLA